MHSKFLRSERDKKDMNFAMRLSFSVGLFMLLIKTYAYFITGSMAILSDAAESVIHVFAVGFAAYSMWLSLQPPDEEHLYGHEKVEFFSAGFEGAMIIAAAGFIFYEAIKKILLGVHIDNIDSGLGFILSVIVINFILGLYLLRKGKRHNSIVLEANGKHILTDCWTSIAVVVALVLVKITKIPLFDPLIAILAALNILWTGVKLILRSVWGLMDRADQNLHKLIVTIIEHETEKRLIHYQCLRHRHSGNKVFIEFHLLFPDDMTLAEAHTLATEVEGTLQQGLELDCDIITHLEPTSH